MSKHPGKSLWVYGEMPLTSTLSPVRSLVGVKFLLILRESESGSRRAPGWTSENHHC